MTETRCSACGKAMVCGLHDPAGCWCARMPPLAAGAIAAGQSCLCEDCLRLRQARTRIASKGAADSP
jgi:hypothetical protein